MTFLNTDTLNLEEAAGFLHVHAETLAAEARSGAIPAAKVGRSWVFMREDLLTYLRQLIAAQTSERLRS